LQQTMPNCSIRVAICPRCGHRWKPHGSKPAMCARCKVPFEGPLKPLWESAPGYRCTRCAHRWLARPGNPRPVACSSCKSAYWDRPKKKRG